jgi:type II secretory pathway pseudopilin PulG
MTRRAVQFQSAGRRGFSFVEILFAVMILGIGFIMVAAMFPVAIHQTEASNRETIAASLGRAGKECLSKTALVQLPYGVPLGTPTYSVLTPTMPFPVGAAPLPPGVSTTVYYGKVWSMYDVAPAHDSVAHASLLWGSVARNLIQQVDPRFAWIAMYRRDYIASGTPGAVPTSITPAPYAQVIVIGVQSQNKPAYVNTSRGGAGLTPISDAPAIPLPGDLLPQFSTGATFKPPVATPFSTITFAPGSSTPPLVLAEGSYVIISNAAAIPRYNGRIYRLGTQLSVTPNTWEFLPGQGMLPSDAANFPSLTADVFIVGPGYDFNHPAQGIHGPSEAISAYSTYITVPN